MAGSLQEAIQTVPPTQVVHEEEDGHTIDYPARALFMQAIIHGIEHRTNITALISGLGLPVPEVDARGYLFSHPEPCELKDT